MLNPDVPIEELKLAYTNWREMKGGNLDQVLGLFDDQIDTVVWIGRCHWRNKHDGKEIDTPKIDVWTFQGGKAVRFFEMFDSLGFARAASLI